MPTILQQFIGERSLKTTAYAAAIQAATGEPPVIERYEDYTEIQFTPSQVKTLQGMLETWHNQEPGTVRIGIGPVMLPYYLKRYWYYIAATAGIGFALAWIAKRR